MHHPNNAPIVFLYTYATPVFDAIDKIFISFLLVVRKNNHGSSVVCSYMNEKKW